MANLFNNTLADLIEMTARLYGDWKSGVADGGSTSTVVDDEREEADDYFQNTTPVSKIRIVSTTDGAAPQGETRTVYDYVFATGLITVTSTKLFTGAVDTNDTYAILSELEWDEVKWAINTAIDMVAKDALEWAIDETTMVAQSDTYEYVLPTNFIYLVRVSQANSDGIFPYSVPPDQYRVLRSAIPRIKFLTMPIDEQHQGVYYSDLWVTQSLSDGKVFRLEGLARPAKLDKDADTTSVSPSYLMFQAAALLHRKKIADPRYDSAYHKARAEQCEQLANIERARIESVALPPNSKKVRD